MGLGLRATITRKEEGSPITYHVHTAIMVAEFKLLGASEINACKRFGLVLKALITTQTLNPTLVGF